MLLYSHPLEQLLLCVFLIVAFLTGVTLNLTPVCLSLMASDTEDADLQVVYLYMMDLHYYHTKWKEAQEIPLRPGTRQECLLSLLLFNIVPEDLIKT